MVRKEYISREELRKRDEKLIRTLILPFTIKDKSYREKIVRKVFAEVDKV